jgi:hypothetical protein
MAGFYQAVVMIHKDPWSSTDSRNYYTAILGYDDPYTLVS